MEMRVASLPELQELRQHVLLTLCTHDNLAPDQTPLDEATMTRSGRPCGLFFQVSGPRLLKAYAVWAGDEDRILFYDCNGLRFAETRLSEAPEVEKLAEERARPARRLAA
jgi:hypothetical protein